MNEYTEEMMSFRVEDSILESIGATERDLWADFILND